MFLHFKSLLSRGHAVVKKILQWLLSSRVTAVVGLFGVAFAIYTAFYYERKPELSISVDSISKVFDLHKPIGGLEVSYGGENLRSSKKNLWVLTATIKNVGNAEIRRGDYDERAPIGVEVSGASVAERPTLKANSEYLTSNLSVVVTGSRLLFSPVILEPGESFEVTALLLGSEASQPTVASVGKVAGIKTISITTPESSSPERNVWAITVGGVPIWVQPLRGVIYSIATILALVLLVPMVVALFAPINKFNGKLVKKSRYKRLFKYKPADGLDKETQFAVERYLEKGEEGLGLAVVYLRLRKKRDELKRKIRDRPDGQELMMLIPEPFPVRRYMLEIETELRKIGVDIEEDGQAEKLEVAVGGLLDYLGPKSKGLASKPQSDLGTHLLGESSLE